MHLINSFLFKNTPSGDDVLYTALINKATTLGYTLPSAPTLSALNTLIKDMRRIGMIQRLDLFHVYASDLGATTPFRLMNIVNAEMIGTSNNGVLWSNQGSKGVVSSRAYINTNFIPYTGGYNYQLNNACIGVVQFEEYTAVSNNSRRLIGLTNLTTTGAATTILASQDTNVNRINGANNTATSIDMTGLGLKCISRSSSTQVHLYNVHNDFITTSNSTTLENAPMCVHVASQISGSANVYFGDNGISCAFAGASITFEMVQNFRQVYNKYLRTIGLQQVA